MRSKEQQLVPDFAAGVDINERQTVGGGEKGGQKRIPTLRRLVNTHENLRIRMAIGDILDDFAGGEEDWYKLFENPVFIELVLVEAEAGIKNMKQVLERGMTIRQSIEKHVDDLVKLGESMFPKERMDQERLRQKLSDRELNLYKKARKAIFDARKELDDEWDNLSTEQSDVIISNLFSNLERLDHIYQTELEHLKSIAEKINNLASEMAGLAPSEERARENGNLIMNKLRALVDFQVKIGQRFDELVYDEEDDLEKGDNQDQFRSKKNVNAKADDEDVAVAKRRAK